ncbi:MAG: exodeoxyribonuclease V subunit alpha [Kineosporiaceae bacterium]
MTARTPGVGRAPAPTSARDTDPGDARRAVSATGLLAEANEAGVVRAGDLQVARRLGRLCAEEDPRVLLAAALAVRALRSGSVCVRPDDLADLAVPDAEDAAEDRPSLAWPDPPAWLDALAASPMVGRGEAEPESPRPLRLVDGRLYLDRYWRDEQRVRDEIDRRAATATPPGDPSRLGAAVRRVLPAPEDSLQRDACEAAASGLLAVVTGGPGTGKTTAITRLIAVLHEIDPAPLRVALAAPTGKAAARLGEAVAEETAQLASNGLLPPRMTTPPAPTTLHRLLGLGRSGSAAGRGRHDRDHHLPHDVVVVDETSMVSLPLMARLLDALRPDARLVLVGDPDQLTSVEAGAVFADVVARLGARPHTARAVVRLERVHRFGGAVAALADAIRRGDGEAALAVLHGDDEAVTLVADDDPSLRGIRDDVVASATARLAAARAGDATAALAALAGHRVLVGHRRGRWGLTGWSARVLEWETRAGLAPASHAVGRAVIARSNDPATGLANGDTGVVLPGGTGGAVAVFGSGPRPLELPLHRLADVDPLLALTIHRSQGSQYDGVSVVLPPAHSPLLTRELLYTAVTRARRTVRVVGDDAAVAAAVSRSVRRASGLRQ